MKRKGKKRHTKKYHKKCQTGREFTLKKRKRVQGSDEKEESRL